ncbi:unnamed protein product, partial [Pylaiella littoralis]
RRRIHLDSLPPLARLGHQAATKPQRFAPSCPCIHFGTCRNCGNSVPGWPGSPPRADVGGGCGTAPPRRTAMITFYARYQPPERRYGRCLDQARGLAGEL